MYLYALFGFVLCVVSIGANFQHDFPAEVLTDPKFEMLMGIFAQYQAHHTLQRRSGILDPSYCQRKFVVARYSCPHMVGNRMHEFLNGYAAAFVTNRTVLWEYCTRKLCQLDNLGDCDQAIERSSWMPSVQDAQQLWKENNCEGSFDTVELYSPHFYYLADEIAMCCGLDDITIPVISYGMLERHEFFGLSVANARLSPASKARAKLLFEHGEHFGYGALFRTAFRYRESVIASNDKVLAAVGLPLPQTGAPRDNTPPALSRSDNARPFVLGMHLRHAGGPEEGVDTSGIKCIQTVLAENNVTSQPCVILLVSDRNESIHQYQNNPEIPCKVYTSTHDVTHPQWNEHGPFTLTAMHDIEFASRADVYLGSGYTHPALRVYASTFSMLMAERVASGASRYHTKFSPRFLQSCQPVLAGRYTNVKYIYLEDTPCLDKKDLPGTCSSESSTNTA